MARIRVGNVRIGGGRKASVGFHAGPVGVTFGGGRKRRRSSGVSPSYEVYKNWDDLTDEEKTKIPLDSMKYLDESRLSSKDAALIAFRRQKRRTKRIVISTIVVLFVLTTLTILSPLIFSSMAILSIAASVVLIQKLNLASREKHGSDQTVSKLDTWALSNMSRANIGANLLFLLLILFTIFVTNTDFSHICQKNELGNFDLKTYSFNSWVMGISNCQALSNRTTYLKVSIILLAFSTLLSLIPWLISSRKRPA